MDPSAGIIYLVTLPKISGLILPPKILILTLYFVPYDRKDLSSQFTEDILLETST